MINPFKDVKWNPGTEDKRRFAKSLIIGFPCIALVLLLIRRIASGAWHPELSVWIGGVGLSVGVILFALPFLAKPVYVVWYFLACSIGVVVSNVLFIGFFYLVVTPLGLVLRVLGKGGVQKRFARTSATYWHDVERVQDVKRYYSQF